MSEYNWIVFEDYMREYSKDPICNHELEAIAMMGLKLYQDVEHAIPMNVMINLASEDTKRFYALLDSACGPNRAAFALYALVMLPSIEPRDNLEKALSNLNELMASRVGAF